MKKAVIQIGSKQYVVSEKQILDVELENSQSELKLKPLLVIDGDSVLVGQPQLDKSLVTAKVLETVLGDKVTAIRYKAKKRVHKTHGHRQRHSRVEIVKIS